MGNLEDKAPKLPKFNLMLKIALSLSAGIAWLIFLIVWLFFIAERFNVYQNIAIFLLFLRIVPLFQ